MPEGNYFKERIVSPFTAGAIIIGGLAIGVGADVYGHDIIGGMMNHSVQTVLDKPYREPSEPSNILAPKGTSVTVLCNRHNGLFSTDLPNLPGRPSRANLSIDYFPEAVWRQILDTNMCDWN